MTLLRPSAQEMMMRRCGGFEGFGISIPFPSLRVFGRIGGKEGGTSRGGANQRIPATNWLINVGQTTTVLQVFTRQVDSEKPIPACAALPGQSSPPYRCSPTLHVLSCMCIVCSALLYASSPIPIPLLETPAQSLIPPY